MSSLSCSPFHTFLSDKCAAHVNGLFSSCSCSTAIGIRCKDGVVFGVEKLVLSKLYEEGSNKRIFNIDRHVGMVRAYDQEIKIHVCSVTNEGP